ncbi:hypothetical protein K461DRAFT_88827 [Myriangium duriaei CBS 260.36]|uniref:Interferon-related developmental regulator N-terminal domain-containing protein n=1 Tax=Myriangium duriaei CBS 260.36 TaxID=1168546 RepID=A0A9P4J8K6_9PEZI|nr:hypothetical protein K461DRAFT_88827 [Myriangium duriaei CBS 260.36]
MHDLRRQALESGKTVSRKAKSRQSSAASSKNASPAVSRNASRVASRSASDDEGNLSDTTDFSTASIDDLSASIEEIDDQPGGWTQHLADMVTLITDRKRSSVQGREGTINHFSRILMAHYAKDEIFSSIEELVPALLKCARAGASERESVLALKAIALILITAPSDVSYDTLGQSLRSIVTDAQSGEVKVAAIHTLSVAVFYGGASLEETEDVMTLLLEIVESDGTSVEAEDDADVVTASLEAWGFLATQLDDMEDSSEEAVDALADQLESSHTNVQIAAGENIALLYEKSCTELEEDEDPQDAEIDVDPETYTANGPKMIRRYPVYGREHMLIQKLSELSNISTKRLSKKDRRTMHSSFPDIVKTVEHPSHGTKTLRVGIGGNVMHIKTWEQLQRFKALKRVLQSGFVIHYTENEAVFETIPLILSERQRTTKGVSTTRPHSGRMEYVNGMLGVGDDGE